MNDGVIVFGAGGHAKVVVSTLLAAAIPVAAVVDDDRGKWGKSILGFPVTGCDPEKDLAGRRGVIAIGDNRTREGLEKRFPGVLWETVVHPHAWVHPSVTLGAGTVVFAGAVIQPDTVIGRHCIVNSRASIDHDCSVGDYCHIAPGVCLAGEVSVGEGAFLGIGSVVIVGKEVGAWSIIGAGGAVTSDIPAHVTAVGVPARIVKEHGLPITRQDENDQ